MEKLLEVQVGEALRAQGLTLCTAESCTGGLIASRLTDIAGSSAYVLGGIVAYSNTAKQQLLNVRQGTLMAYGAVSEPTAGEMATGARALFEADVAVSVTGIAGPGGGTAEKPVGLTFIGVAGPGDALTVRRFVWEHDRLGNKASSADAAFDMILQALSSTQT